MAAACLTETPAKDNKTQADATITIFDLRHYLAVDMRPENGSTVRI